jgi:hypothetical protein
MKRVWTLAAALALALGLAAPAGATGTVDWGKVVLVTGGWNVPMVGVQTTAAAANPDNCPSGGLYVVPPDSPSRELFTSMLLTAYSRGDQVQLTVSGCYTWPIIIGVQIRPAQ